jgi:sugar/nucleoside kinase (ribokinase family)
MIGAVGEDWPEEHTALLKRKGIDTSGLQIIPGGKTFRWRGRYLPNMNDRETIEVHLNVLDEFQPKLGPTHQDCRFLFLGNASPAVQLDVLKQAKNAELTVADTMDLWINIQRDELNELLTKIDGLVLNDAEAKLLAEDENLVRAGHAIRAMGPRFVVIKKGEHGAMFFSEHEMYVMPAFPTEKVLDPTGAGDSFAGGMMGHLASLGRFDPQALKEALAYGTVTASFTVEDFSLGRLEKLDRSLLDQRLKEYRQMLSF